MISTPEVFNNDIPMSPSQYVIVKKPIVGKSLRQFLESLDVKPNTYVRSFCVTKSKHKAIRYGCMLWFIIPKK